MKTLLNLEYVGGFLLALILFSQLPFAWWLYPVVFFAPDISAAGYLAGPKVGAATYNMAHHLALAVCVYGIGTAGSLPWFQLAGTVLLGHIFFDRFLGFGLKYPDSFKHTHLGTMK